MIRSPTNWLCRNRTLHFQRQPLIMGILNATPDSFSDGGRYATPPAAATRARELADHGADIVDIGGESTRPGAEEVPATEEIARILPALQALAGHQSVALSVDTRKASVARAALDAGAHIINDVSALTHDPDMAHLIASSGAGVILMHMRGNPQTMQNQPHYTDVVQEVAEYLGLRIQAAVDAGIPRAAIAIDPGIGFGKLLEHNLALLANLHVFTTLGVPVVLGASRKSFLATLTGRTTDNRLAGSLAAAVRAADRGANVLRVHDVRETVDAVRVALAIRDAEKGTTP